MTTSDELAARRPNQARGEMAKPAVPDVVAPPPRHPRFPLVDGMRAVAVLAVVAVHVTSVAHPSLGSLPGRLLVRMNIGVTIFFLVSGFLLYRPMVAYRGGGAAAPRPRDYLKRRILRIYPAYWLVLTVLLVLPDVPRVMFGPWWAMFGLVHTLPLFHGTRCVAAVAPPCGLAQTWSLVVEVTFYAVLPLYCAATEYLTRRLAVTAWAVSQAVLLTALSALSVALQFSILNPVPTWFGATVCAYVLWFALGMLMAVVSVWWEVRAPGALQRMPGTVAGGLWGAAGAIFVGLALWLPPTAFLVDRTQVMLAHILYGVLAALLLAPAAFNMSRGIPRTVLSRRPVAWLGEISYGIFLWHLAIMLQLGSRPVVVLFAETLALSITCAAVSYYVVERPLLRLKYVPLRSIPGRLSRTIRTS
jgi:peptidoglycan/LPS O-acetylase OafA/YrhL